MDPQSTAVAVTTPEESPQQPEMASENIARFVKEHEVTAVRRNMHIHEDEDADSPEAD